MPGRSRRPLVPDIAGIDLDFRPTSYQPDHDPLAAVLQNVKGARRREMIADFLRGHAPSELGAIDADLLQDAVDEATRVSLGRIHPSFMGGEYLPDYRPGEVEIARIVLDSVTRDVYSIRARRRRPGARWRYAMADEYEATFYLTQRTSTRPLSMREVIALIDGATSDMVDTRHERFPEGIIAWNIFEYGNSAEDAAGFLAVESEVYPQLAEYYERRLLAYAEAAVAERDGDDEEGHDDGGGDDDGPEPTPPAPSVMDQKLPEWLVADLKAKGCTEYLYPAQMEMVGD